MAANVGKDIIELDGEDDQQKDGPIVPIVCHVAKIAERAAEKSKAEDTQADTLDVTLGLIRDQAADGNQRDCQRKQGNIQAIPIIQDGECE